MKSPFIGFHYDIARGCYLRTETFHRALRLAAASGYTHFVPYLENLIHLPSMEKACPESAYTAEDWRGFEEVAAQAGIELVPHFNVIGHTEVFGEAYPELGSRDEDDHMELDPERSAAIKWTQRCLEEFCAISHSEYFLIGGDEWQPSPDLLLRPGYDVATAWVEQINRSVEILAAHGRIPIVWHDFALHYPRALERLSRRAVLAFWHYDQDSDYPVIDTFRGMGFKTFMASAVFSGTPRLTLRSAATLRCAARAAERHHAEGILVTTWDQARWELQSANIPLAAKILRGENPPESLVQAMTYVEMIRKFPARNKMAEQLKATALELLNDPCFDKFPVLRRYSQAQLSGNRKENLASYLEYHTAEGPQFELIRDGNVLPIWHEKPVIVASSRQEAPRLDFEEDLQLGTILKFSNDNDSFEIYPHFGATLQNWRHGSHQLITRWIEGARGRKLYPGGYRSYAALGGLRPIWALGAHSNPSILWQFPYAWQVTEQSSERIVVELSREFHHVSILLRIGVERDQKGFFYEAHGVNRLAGAWAGFNFNLTVPFYLDDIEGLKFLWQEDGRLQKTSVAEEKQNAFWIPSQGPLTLRYPDHALHIEASPEETAGYFVDSGSGFVTPDLRAVYRPRSVGEEVTTRWRFYSE